MRKEYKEINDKIQRKAEELNGYMLEAQRKHLKNNALKDKSKLKEDVLKARFAQNEDYYDDQIDDIISLLDTLEDTLRAAVLSKSFNQYPYNDTKVYFLDNHYDYPAGNYHGEEGTFKAQQYLNFKDTNFILSHGNKVFVSLDDSILDSLWRYHGLVSSYFNLQSRLNSADYTWYREASGDLDPSNLKDTPKYPLKFIHKKLEELEIRHPMVIRMDLLTRDEVQKRVWDQAVSLRDNGQRLI